MKDNIAGGSDWLGLAGQVCVITGGGIGIGAGAARHLASLGASVAILDRNAAAATETAAAIGREGGGRALGLEADVAQPESVAAAAERIQRELGPCRLLVNNAAVRQAGDLVELPLDQWNRLLSINLTGAFLCVQVFGQQMIAAGRGGSIVNIASVHGSNPKVGGGVYSVAKAGLMMFSRVISVELAPHGIRSNVISPGMIRTSGNASRYQDAEAMRARERAVPAQRIGDPDDIAHAIAFLASDRSSYVTGQELVVDGGLTQTLMRNVPGTGQQRKS